ncbi:MAG: hypothetical protein H7281_12085 [Bacteriovorax sp.]|nr:hypothetical protein [Bacteriovorax sp.]
MKIFLITFIFSISSISLAGTNEFAFHKGNLAILAPPVINKDYYLLEFGFVTEKKIKYWDYSYNAYVNAALFEDWLGKTDRLRAGGLGFKGGVILPTQPWIPLLFTVTVGYAKTVLNKNPLIGNESSNVSKKDMILLETGILYHYDKYFLRFAYQRSNVKYFSRHTILMLGVSY